MDDRPSESLRRIVTRFAGLAAATVFAQLIGFVALAYVSRKVGSRYIGAYTIAYTFTQYGAVFVNAGITNKAVRDIARDPQGADVAVSEAVVLQCLLGAFVYVIMLALTSAVPTHAARDMLPIVAVMPLITALTLDWPLLALGRARPVGIWRALGQVAYAVPIPFVVTTGLAGGLAYAGLNMLGLVVAAVGLFYYYSRHFRGRWTRPSFRAIFTRLKESLGFAAVQVLLTILGGIGPLMLGYLSSARAVGLFAVAYKLPYGIVTLTQAWLNAFFPHAARELETNPDGFAEQLAVVLSVAIVVTLIISVGAFLSADHLMVLIYGTSFSAAATPFALLSVSAGLVVVQACVTEGVLMSMGSQHYYVMMLAAAVPFMLGVQVGLILAFGVDGAAGAAIVGDLYLAIGGAIGVRRKIGHIGLRKSIILRGALSVALMGTAMEFARTLGLFPELAGGGLALLAGLRLSGLQKELFSTS